MKRLRQWFRARAEKMRIDAVVRDYVEREVNRIVANLDDLEAEVMSLSRVKR